MGEACTSRFGVLSEEVFGSVLDCNDRLQKLLAEVDTRMKTETPATTTAASATGVPVRSAPPDDTNDITGQLDDLLLGNEDPFAESHASGGDLNAMATTPA